MPAALHLHLLLLLLLLLLRGRGLLLLLLLMLLLLLQSQYNACPVVKLLLLLKCIRSMGLSDQPRQRALSRLCPLRSQLQGPWVLLLLLCRLADGSRGHCQRGRLRHRRDSARRGRVGQALGVLVVARAACWGPGRRCPGRHSTCRAHHAHLTPT